MAWTLTAVPDLVRDLVHLPVRDRAGVLPGAEHGVAGQAKLLPQVLGELLRSPLRALEVGLELSGEGLEVLGRELRVAVDALLLLALVEDVSNSPLGRSKTTSENIMMKRR